MQKTQETSEIRNECDTCVRGDCQNCWVKSAASLPTIFEVTEWPHHSLGRFVEGMQIVADCSSLGNGYGKKMVKGNESSWYVCLPCVGKAVCVREDLIKPEGKSWLESCQTCGRRLQN